VSSIGQGGGEFAGVSKLKLSDQISASHKSKYRAGSPKLRTTI
jgi:hypothetical protein